MAGGRRRIAQGGWSQVPDETLQHVLSFLPAREAVRTCVLARRWRHLWRSMPALRITSGPRWDQITQQEFNNLNIVVNNLLLYRDRNSSLDLCEFLINPFENFEEELEVSQIRLWIQQSPLCKARILRVEFDEPGEYLRLHNLHLVSQHLTTLKLKCVHLESDFLDFSSCLALKNLWMKGCSIRAKKISSHSLKHLTMFHCYFRGRTRTRISAPSLVWLELSNNHRKTPFLESMPSLVRALVRLRDCDDRCGKEEFGGSCFNNSCTNCEDNGDRSVGCLFLEGLSKAESLELVAGPGTFIFKRDLIWCPTFNKLKALLLNEWCVAIDFCAIVCFLQHTPVLEKLTLQLAKAPKNCVEANGTYNPSKRHFSSKKLKVVEVKCEAFDKWVHKLFRILVHKLFRILSTHGVCIEQINIQRTGRCSECYGFQTDADLLW